MYRYLVAHHCIPRRWRFASASTCQPGSNWGVLQWPDDTPPRVCKGCDLWSRWEKSIDGVRDLDQLTCKVWTLFAGRHVIRLWINRYPPEAEVVDVACDAHEAALWRRSAHHVRRFGLTHSICMQFISEISSTYNAHWLRLMLLINLYLCLNFVHHGRSRFNGYKHAYRFSFFWRNCLVGVLTNSLSIECDGLNYFS
ncbi:hypothetical protein VO64_4977 [Pseudomonas synxantha]|uniref:Uncharacterized protein n=1 Tax=Pseudomonas synxantha TaxID=47883 RepID=A0AAU8U592_9PSED|nr:hypothetical protein VO64_4977 [Pseudomonas synxantha]